jgi:hypothetical protein
MLRTKFRVKVEIMEAKNCDRKKEVKASELHLAHPGPPSYVRTHPVPSELHAEPTKLKV